MEIVEVEASGDLLRRVYEQVLEPSFPRDELSPLADVEAIADSRQRLVWAAVEDGEVLGAAVGEWDPEPRVVLLSWLAARPGLRGGGVGGPLLDQVTSAWTSDFDPCMILAEIEDPRCHEGGEQHGDPAARLRFYARRGARPLNLPHFQAALSPEQNRVHDLLLMVLHTGPTFAGEEPDTIRGDVLRRFIELYQIGCEGSVGTDDEALALYAAIDRPGGVPYLALDMEEAAVTRAVRHP